MGGSGSRCVPAGGPCYCGGSSGCQGTCDVCSEDGTCDEDCSTCQSCYTKVVSCDCGSIFTIKCCFSTCPDANGRIKGFSDCQPDCDSLCPPRPPGSGDPCDGECRYITVCDGNPPPCPPKSTCTGVGDISGGGSNCTITKVCDKSNIPDSCGECDCNCDNDCPNCKICNSNGVCVDDPTCESTWIAQIFYRTIVEQYSCRDLDCDTISTPLGVLEVVKSYAWQEDDFPGFGSWQLVSSGEDFAFASCAVVCNFPADRFAPNGTGTYWNVNYMAVTVDNNQTLYGDTIVYSGGVGFNYMSVGKYTFGEVVGYGETQEEADADARSKLPVSPGG